MARRRPPPSPSAPSQSGGAGAWPSRRPGAQEAASSSLHQRLRAFKVEADAHLFEAGFAQHMPQAFLVLGIQQQEAAAAGTDQLSAHGPVAHRKLIPGINLQIRHRSRSLLLVLPM